MTKTKPYQILREQVMNWFRILWKTRHYQILIGIFLYRYLSANSFGIDDLDEEEAEEIENLMDGFLQ